VSIHLEKIAETRKYAIPLYLSLIAAGLVGNYFKFPILNADFIFGSIFAMLALQFFGLGRGIAAAAIIASYTYFAWNHPYGIITMTAEVAVVGYLINRLKINLLTADALYWCFIGIPLGYFCFHIITNLPAGNSIFLMTKQAINGIANALVARLIFTGYALRSNSSQISFREILSNLLAFFVICTALIMLAVTSSADFAETDHHIRSSLTQDSRRVAENLENWVENRKLPIVNLARMAETLSSSQMQPRLEQQRTSDINFVRIVLLNKESFSTAHAPPVDEQGRSTIGWSYADRPFIPTLKRTLQPMLSEVVLSKIGRTVPIAIMIVPVLARGEYDGCVSGILNFDRIQAILKTNTEGTNMLYSLLDKNGNVIVSNRSDQKIMTPFSRSKGTMSRPEAGLSQWVPVLPPNTSTIALWGKSFYVAESPIGNMAEWKLVLEQPVAPFQKVLYERYTGRIILLFIILLVALAIAEMLSRQIAATNEQLINLTHDLPVKVASGTTIAWPESGIKDNSNLIDNFRGMADALSARFNETRQLNESLEQRVAERTGELQASDERFRLSMEATNDGLWDWNVNLDEWYFSPGYYAMLGYEVGEFPATGNAWRERIHPDDRENVLQANGDCIEGRSEYFEIEYRMKAKNGDWCWILGRGKCVARDERGGAIRLVGTHVDITERKLAEEEHAKLEAQLQQSQKMESVGRLAGGVAHDFNNMLGVILGHAEIAMDQVDPSQPLHADLREIRNAAQRSADLTRQLLAFARKQVVAPKVLDMNDTISGMLKMLQRLIGEDIHLVWLPGVSLWPAKIDPSQIDQILANLCINARDAIAGVGKLTIETKNIRFDEDYCADHAGFVPGEFVLLVVSDDGSGMDKETIDKIFEPFFTTKGIGKGTGLGLATVYGIVKQNNGFINVYSEPGQGTTFKIYLPRYIGKAEQTRTEVAVEPLRRGQETILLVEDEPTLLELSKLLLETQGYRVLAAGSPGEAIRLAGENTGEIHLLMTDVVMPEMNGRDLAKKLLALYPHLKCLFTSGYTANVIAHHGVLDENVNFIQKPFSRRDLAAKVREVLDQNG